MKAIVDPRQAKHNPQHFMATGKILPNPEQPRRIEVLKAGAIAAGASFASPKDYGMGPIAAVHSPQYLTFLQNIYSRWSRLETSGPEVIPNIHPAARSDNYPKSAVGQAGYHQADTACPINGETWESAYWSAQTAINAAELIRKGNNCAYALSRPPGHHAFSDLAGGFCFLNNSAIAAKHLSSCGNRVAILDVDVHHGNGTQGIFYETNEIFTVSLHADTERFYPFFWGQKQERGKGVGNGYNLNIPLTRGTSDKEYLHALQNALNAVSTFGADVVVVALGLDAYENDPLKGLAITTDGFGRIGAAIASLKCPTLFVQEGGYLSEELGHNLTSFLNGFGGL